MTTLLDLLESARFGETDLLQCRMLVLGVDAEAWARFEPGMLSDLKSTCVACSARQQCAYDLLTHLDDATWPDWRDYCPNTANLGMLSALQSFLGSGLPIGRAVERFADHPQSVSVETD
jgi:hypothetical protein